MAKTHRHHSPPHHSLLRHKDNRDLRLVPSKIGNQLCPPSIYRERRLHELRKALEERKKMLARIHAAFDNIGRPVNSDGEWEGEVTPGFAVVVVRKDRSELDMYEVFDDDEYADGGVGYVLSEAGASATQETPAMGSVGTVSSGVVTNNCSGRVLPTTLATKRFGRN